MILHSLNLPCLRLVRVDSDVVRTTVIPDGARRVTEKTSHSLTLEINGRREVIG